ncbi:spatacsin [Frankliniella occidentalis]|uniref:Spatacsin n=1 Tax=Frankliniella occidentalis TaxID=133901 RepID=A0A9C6XRV0_FRAOC|nr:spatacsin [Frankliniella occidentalis]
MIPLPQLLDGLSRGRLEVLQNAFTLHRKAFRSEFVRYLTGGVTTLAEEHVARMAILFETIFNHLKKCDKSSSFGRNVLNLTVDHINGLIFELEGVKLAANSISIQQKNAVLELLNFNFNLLKNLSEEVFIPLQSLPTKGQIGQIGRVHLNPTSSFLMNHLSSKTDEEVVQHALLNFDSLVCAKELLLSRGQSASQVNEFVQCVADAYINELLRKRQMEIAKDVIYNTNRDVWPFLKNMCLNTVDSNIRDYLAFELNSIGLLEPTEVDIWKFLILIEGVIKETEFAIRISKGSFQVDTLVDGEKQLELSMSTMLTSLPHLANAKTSLLIELYFKTSNGTLEPMLNKADCWTYLLCRNQTDVLIKWIHAACSEHLESQQDRLTTFLSSWSLSQDMIDEIQNCACSVSTQEILLDYLSKYGLYTNLESQSVQKVLLRAIRTSQIFHMSDQNIREVFVNFCLSHNIPDLLVSCDITTENQTSPWLELYSKCKILKENPISKKALCDCVKYCANYLNLSESQQWISLSCFLMADNLFGDNHDMLTQYPHLKLLLTKQMDRSHPKDLSLPSLLRQRFSSTSNHSILKHQSLSSMFKDESEITEIDFSHEPTISMYGHKETLDYKYYLKQGRPCHASMLIQSDIIKNFGRPSRKLLKRPVLFAHELAYQNANNQLITASCIAFLEMLGESSQSLRTHLAVMKQIISFLVINQNCDDTFEVPLHLTMSEEKALHPQEMYELLQNSLPLDIYKQGLAVQFAVLHNLPLPRKFLEYCGQKNDWMNYLLFCQIYCYPPETVKSFAKNFQSVALTEHFSSFLLSKSSKLSIDSTRQRSGGRLSTADVPCLKDLAQLPSTEQGSVTIPSILLNSCTKDSLFGVLLAAHNCADPGEALLHTCVEFPCPVLALLADFYQVNAEAQLVAWLASWFPKEERVNFECWPKTEPWPTDMVELVILQSLEISCSNLLTGFQIFMPEHPLVLVIDLMDGLFRQNQTLDHKPLIVFKDSCSTLGDRDEQWSLSNANFVSDIGLKVLIKSLECLPFLTQKIRLLKIIASVDISLPSGFDCSKLLAILNILEPLEVDFDVKQYFRDSAAEIQKCTEKLISLQLFEEATALSGNSFIIEEQTYKFKKRMNSRYPDIKGFCKDCSSSFDHWNVDPYTAFTFFQSCASNLKKNEDRWRALYHATIWLKRSLSNNPHIERSDLVDEIELKMWQCCFCDNNELVFHVLAEELQNSSLSSLCTKKLARSFKFSDDFHKCNRVCKKRQCPTELLNCLLDIGDIVSASRVQYFFQSNHKDLEILESCINLAEENISEQNIPRKWAKVFGLSSDNDGSESNFSDLKEETQEQQFSSETLENMKYSSTRTKILSVIQILGKHLHHGKEIGKQLVACYRLAINLGLSYSDVIAVDDPLKLLRSPVFHNIGDYSIAADTMVALRMSSSERSKFLSREIIAAISKGPAPGSAKVFLLWGYDLEQHFRHVLDLVPDPSLLGNELMIMVSKLAILDKNTPKAVLSTAVELLVRAHDCYAAACHMEGIAQVLRTVSSFAPVLKSRSEWALMVRLLTGIQRYTEMNYIFKILKENDHFEFLLRKDSVKPLSFKLALLDWLRRECPNDIALLKMTAAHFAMHEQEAALWQKEGNDCIHQLVDNNGLQNNQKTKIGLQTAMQDFSHAAECYLQADMLNHAMTCAHQAELMALQIYLLSSTSDGATLRVIMLDSKSIAKLIVSTLSFNQALIVARAYNHRPDWAAALFYHCISPGLSAEEYFTTWSSCMELTPSIVQSIAYRLQRTTAVTREMTANMKWLLGHVKDMDVRYKIASELGLKEMVESLLNAPEVAYLKDTVWQSGFKRQ